MADIYPVITEDRLTAVPLAMKNAKRWVVWFDHKVPVKATANNNGELWTCDVTNPDNWCTFAEAVSALGKQCHGSNGLKGTAVGVGFVVGDGYYCIDVDGGREHGRELPSDEIVFDLMRIGTYVEVSVSMHGYHAFGRTTEMLDMITSYAESETSAEVEYFSKRKFIAITGNILLGTYENLTDDDQTWFVDKYITTPYNAREQANRERLNRQVRDRITASDDEKYRFFMANYLTILRNSDSGLYHRGQWVGLVKALRDYGVPYSDVLEWCQGGHNFKSERDVRKVWEESKSSKGRPISVGVLINEVKSKGIDLTLTESFMRTEPKRPTANTELVKGATVHTVPEKDDHPSDVMALSECPWGDIETKVKIPEFPMDTLPQWCVDYINSFTKATGTPSIYCVASMLGAVSATIVGHSVVQASDTHTERGQLYQVYTGTSGSMKSSAINEFFKPVRDLLHDSNLKVRKENSIHADNVKELQACIDKERHKSHPDTDYIRKAKAEIETEQEGIKATYPTPLDDVTPESLLRRMIPTNGVANIASGEGNIINVITGKSYAKQGQGANLDTFLKGFDGDPVNSSRITSGDMEVVSANLSMLVALQPDMLERLCMSEDSNGRGLTQRFLIYNAPDRQYDFDYENVGTLDRELSQRWYGLIIDIFNRFMRPDNTSAIRMILDSEAEHLVKAYRNKMRDMINEVEKASDTLTGWLSKGHGKVVRLSAIIALISNPNANTVTAEDVRKAIRMMDTYYVPTVKEIYMSSDVLTKPQHAIVDYMVKEYRKGNKKLNQADVWRMLRKWMCFKGDNGKKLFESTVRELIANNYIRVLDMTQGVGNGRNYTISIMELNPKVLEKDNHR